MSTVLSKSPMPPLAKAPSLNKIEDKTAMSEIPITVEKTQTMEPGTDSGAEGVEGATQLQSMTATGGLDFTMLSEHQSVANMQVKKTPNKTPKGSNLKKNNKGKRLGRKVSDTKLNGGGDDEDENSYSEPIVVLQTEENLSYLNRVIIGRLSRLGDRKTLWTTKAESFFVIFSFLISYNTFSDFIFEFDMHGPWFMLPYAFFVAFLAYPMMCVEMALGQYTSSTACVVFDRMAPALMGIGVAVLAYNFVAIVSDEIIIAHLAKLFLYSVKILEDEMPYHNCINDYNSFNCRSLVHPNCEDLNAQIEKKSKISPLYREQTGLRYVAYGDMCIQSMMAPVYTEEMEPLKVDQAPFNVWMSAFSHSQFLHWNFDMEEGKYRFFPHTSHLFVHCFAWFLVYYACQQSQEFIIRVTKGTMFLALSAFLTLLLAVLFFVPPSFPYLNALTMGSEKLNELGPWISALTLVVRLFKLGQGGFIYLGAQNDIHNSICVDALIIAAVMTVLPLLYAVIHALITDSFILGLFKGDREKWFAAAGNAFHHHLFSSESPLIHFSIFAASLTSLREYECFTLAVISFTGILIVMTSKIMHVEVIVSSIMEFGFEPGDHSLIVTTVIFACAFGTLMFQGARGFEILVGTDNLLLPILGITMIVCEIIALYIYGPYRFFANMTFLSHRRNKDDNWWKRWGLNGLYVFLLFLALFGVPACAGFHIVGMIKTNKFDATMTSYMTFLFAIIAGIIPAVAYHRMSTQFYKSGDFWGLFVPNRDLWGPRSRADKEVAELVERELRFQGFGLKKQTEIKKKK